MCKRAFYILLPLFAPFILFAQAFKPNPEWRFENFNKQNHFISRSIIDLTEDNYGYMWACSRGVQRFDGYKTLDFNRFDPSSGSLRINATNIIKDNTGRIWVSSAGICYYNDATGKFVYIADPDKAHHITNVYSPCLLNKDIWFVCDYGLCRLDLRTLKISFTSLTYVPNPLCIYAIDGKSLLISDREKVFTYSITHDSYKATSLIYDNALLKIFKVIKGNGRYYLGTNSGLFTTADIYHINPQPTPISGIAINDLVFMQQDKTHNYLFTGTDGKGIMIYNTGENKVEFTFAHNNGDENTLPDDDIGKFHEDQHGHLWVGTATGISMLDTSAQQWKIHFLDKHGTDELYITRLAPDKFDSTKVWLACRELGMVKLNWKTKKTENIYNTRQITRVIDFVQLGKDDWLLTTADKLIRWNSATNRLKTQSLPVQDSIKVLYIIRRLFYTDMHTCFITSNKGLFKYNLTTNNITVAAQYPPTASKQEQLKYDLVKGFYKNGLLWIASRNGLFNYDVATGGSRVYGGSSTSTDYYFIDAVSAPDGQVICSGINGIAIFNTHTKKMAVVNTIDNLYKPCCESVTCLHHKVWIGTEAGLVGYDLLTRKFAKAEHEPEQIEDVPTSPFAVLNNTIVAGYQNKYVVYTPDAEQDQLPSDPVIESITANNHLVAKHYKQQIGNSNLVFDHENNSINIGFTAFLYTDPDNIKFRYKLAGAGVKWQYADGERSANYAQLSPGTYNFWVQCGNGNGIWNPHIATVNFVIDPPYWATWWFRLLVVAAIVIILYNLYRYQVAHLLAIEKIRERIASDFHDDIGSALSSISIFSEVADQQLALHSPPEKTREIVGHIAMQSRAMLDAMDDIIWAVNPQNDHFNDLAVRMREFAIPLLEAKDIQFEIDIREDILNTRIKMEARRNIFLIFKESVNNILKHSNCTKMWVYVNKINSQLEMVITDNGKGFDPNAPSSRNGLKNMQKRAAAVNAFVHVSAQHGKGTVTRLTINII